ncbi:cytochrome P450 [Calocera viscosa TUFC12733]|uniref:Cytochrome P450 n=1 Tax=Calocera viscosa (strain TUFC12733) TaxID=1330018 RepID=A0A167JPF3_CALVF|nr:cytochrome P450 [Calocera viscosa TUFC12733]
MLFLPSFNSRDLMALSFCGGLLVILALVRRIIGRSKATKLAGPRRTSWLWGYTRVLLAGVSGDYFEGWQKEFGDVYRLPSAVGGEETVFMDSRAISYIFNTNAYNFIRHQGGRNIVKRMVGGGILAAEGDSHRRHRKSMSPGFNVASIRFFTTIFLEATYKVRDRWLAMMVSEGTGKEFVLNVEHWLNAISFDSIGEAGFSHDFKCMEAKPPAIVNTFTSMGKNSGDLASIIAITLVQVLPWVAFLPLGRNVAFDQMQIGMSSIAKGFLKDRKAVTREVSDERRTLVASILKAENHSLTQEDVIAEINTLLLAGFETTSTTMAWCLHELSMNPRVQQKLRDELAKFPEPTHEQLAAEMPYLNAVAQETLRTHPAVPQIPRQAIKDDSVPLQNPITTASGQVVDHIEVRAGQSVLIPIEAMNRSSLIWGPDSHEFKPERWIDGNLPKKVTDIQGFHHLLTFIDGPRNCIGKNFAVAEFKAAISVLIRNFSFAPLNDGSEVHRVLTLVQRVRTKGQDGLLLRVSKVEVD